MKAPVWFINSEFNKRLWLMSDPFGIYRERRMLGTPIWRGYEWWMGTDTPIGFSSQS